jgi:hypothetical protein
MNQVQNSIHNVPLYSLLLFFFNFMYESTTKKSKFCTLLQAFRKQ